ncbi:MAG TPA: SWIM zinc finger family protein [Pirellulales bacterium]|nr:SWIM zinc finger family protein [Pirellulales bacterium]
MYYGWKPYVPVARRRANAARAAKQLSKKRGRELQPITIDGRKIARTFWGEAWCDSLENHSDFENRLPRGRTYVRNGSVIDLDIARGHIDALVSGSEIYTVKVEITGLEPAHWKQLKSECSESIDSLLDLLAGRFSDGVMRRLTDPERGLFPQPKEIKMSCSCPDWAVLCKHAAAVLYGVGARLDQEPQLLFLLRGVDHAELVSEAVSDGNLESALSGSGDALAGEDLGAMFGIELDTGAASETKAKRGRRATSTTRPATKAKPAGKKKAVEEQSPVLVIEKPAAKKSRSAKKPAVAGAKRSGPPESKAVAAPAALPERKKLARRPKAVTVNP